MNDSDYSLGRGAVGDAARQLGHVVKKLEDAVERAEWAIDPRLLPDDEAETVRRAVEGLRVIRHWLLQDIERLWGVVRRG